MIADAYLPNRVDPLGAGSLEFGLDALRLDSTTVGLVSFGTETRLRTTDATHFHVNLPMHGGVVSRMGSKPRRWPFPVGPRCSCPTVRPTSYGERTAFSCA